MNRTAQISAWLYEKLADKPTLTVASEDASARQYFRVGLGEGHSLVVMDAPQMQEEVRAFIDIQQRLLRVGVHVPAIHACDIEQGFVLLDDLGSTHYQDKLNAKTAPDLYRAAIRALVNIQSVPAWDGIPVYDHAMIRRELDLFVEWFLIRHHGYMLSEEEEMAWQQVQASLVDSALSQAQVFVHRDFHCRNLMIKDPTPAVIDFQGAVMGPIAYDVVSLLRDCYVNWPEPDVLGWAQWYWAQAAKAGLPVPLDFEVFHRDMDWIGIQRHLKVLGIFTRLHYRDGKSAYLAELPRVLNYVKSVSAHYPELSFLDGLIRKAQDGSSARAKALAK